MAAILVTGGAGFIGSHLARALSSGNEVVVLDDLSGGFVRNVPNGVFFVQTSITDHEAVERLFKKFKFQYVFHLAAYAAEGLSPFIRRFNYTNNLIGSINLINAAVRHKVKRLVFTSSIAVYGDSTPPFSEAQVPTPIDPYGIAKYAVELDLEAAHRMFGLEYTIFRPHNVFGPHQNIGDRYRNVVGIFMNQLLRGEPLSIFGTGTQTRAFSYIDEVVPCFTRCIDSHATEGQVYNVGGDTIYTVLELAEACLRISGRGGKLAFLPERQEAKHAFADHRKAHRMFGAPAARPLDEGLKVMWAWAEVLGPQEPSRFADIEVTENLPAVYLP